MNQELPNSEKKLLALCTAFKERTNKDFTIGGVLINDYLSDMWESRNTDQTAKPQPKPDTVSLHNHVLTAIPEHFAFYEN